MQPNRTITRVGSYVLALRAWAEHRAHQKERGFWVRHVDAASDHVEHPADAEATQVRLPEDVKPKPHRTNKVTSEDKQKQSEAEAVEKLEDVVEKTQNILTQAKAIFPFDLFPDFITIDRKKITVVHRSFFGVQQTISVRHSDITNVQADVGPFVGSLTITSEHFINNIQTIKYLHRRDAVAIQRLIQGMIIAHKEGIEMNDIEDGKLMSLLNELGNSEVAS